MEKLDTVGGVPLTLYQHVPRTQLGYIGLYGGIFRQQTAPNVFLWQNLYPPVDVHLSLVVKAPLDKTHLHIVVP